MKVRILWVPPAVKHLVPGKVYDLPEALAGELKAKEEAEDAPDATDVEPYDNPDSVFTDKNGRPLKGAALARAKAAAQA